ncbi:MAG: tetratricopeptide repeat protein [Anaerolineae bacterium]|nr:hypothetical protein [Ardenticatenia bacterium]HQZ70626.1 hypothetical protein [Anaerolineae bacterium]HRA19516.1 hypothetical protein [Anaerolineae bacterium]
MYNLLISLAAAALVYLGLSQVAPSPWMAVAGGMLAGAVGFLLLARRTNRQLESRVKDVESALGAGRADEAIAILENTKAQLGRWQFMIPTLIDGQIGVLRYAHKQQLDEARPYLEKALANNWHAKAMLAAYHYKRRQYEAMNKVFEAAVKANKQAELLWAAYAWCEASRGDRDAAVAVLERAVKEVKDSERLKRCLNDLRSKKRLNMTPFTPEWWILHLERPPVQLGTQAGSMRGLPPGARMKVRRVR